MYSSAGILPFTRANGEILFLVGRDVRDSVFSDFGGKTEAVDHNDPINTATREFYEETLGVLCNSPHDLRRRLKELSVCLIGSTKNQHVYRMYLLEVPYFRNLPQRFKKVANFLKYKNIGGNYIEKTELAWCTTEELLKIPKRTVFTETIQTNIQFFRRLRSEPWRRLCEEYKFVWNSDAQIVSSPSPTDGVGKYVPPSRRKTVY